MWKKAVAGIALRARNANSLSRHSAMPGRRVATTVSRDRKNVVSIMSKASPCGAHAASAAGTSGSSMKPKRNVTAWNEYPRSRISMRSAASANGVSSVSTDQKSTRLNSSHMSISYAVFCLKKQLSVLSPADVTKTLVFFDDIASRPYTAKPEQTVDALRCRLTEPLNHPGDVAAVAFQRFGL